MLEKVKKLDRNGFSFIFISSGLEASSVGILWLMLGVTVFLR